mgnify:CR=1 FL=1
MKILGVRLKRIPFYDETYERMRIMNSQSWKESVRTLSVLLLLLLTKILDTSAQYFADAYFALNFNTPNTMASSAASFDLFQANLPKNVIVPFTYVNFGVFSLVLFALISTVIINPKRKIPLQGLTILRRYFFIQSIAYLLHAVSVPLTLTPSLDIDKSAIITLGWARWFGLAAGWEKPLVDGSFSLVSCLTVNVGFFIMAYGWKSFIKLFGLFHSFVVLMLLFFSRRDYSASICLGTLASCFIFGTYHLLLLVFCQSKIFLGIADKASMGFDLFFLNGFFCRYATRCIEWVDGLDLRQLQPFVATLNNDEHDQSLFVSAKSIIP